MGTNSGSTIGCWGTKKSEGRTIGERVRALAGSSSSPAATAS